MRNPKLITLILLGSISIGCGPSVPPVKQVDEDFQKAEQEIINDPNAGPGSKGATTPPAPN